MRRYFGIFFVLLFWSCGTGETANLCESVICEFGSCDPTTGFCPELPGCELQADCPVGYSCVSLECFPISRCVSDNDCDRGTCDGIGCVNSSTCETFQECIRPYDCRGGLCQAPLCTNVSCARGACEEESGECAEPDVCVLDQHCLEGRVCRSGSCSDPGSVCDDIECARGVCNPESEMCDNPDSCEQNLDCLYGHFCYEGMCEVDRCDGLDPCNYGICDPFSATCVNASVCDNFRECIPPFNCIEGTCSDPELSCDCTGNQRCLYDSETLQMVCTERSMCQTSLDCLGARVCNESTRQCGAPTSCGPDANEPNNTQQTATSLEVGELFLGKICSGDIDYFQTAIPSLTDVTVVTLEHYATDIGNGAISLSVTTPDGTVLQVPTDSSGIARVEFPSTAGTVIARVEGSNIEVAGVRYDIAINTVSNETANLCSAIPVLGSLNVFETMPTGPRLETSCMSESDLGTKVYDVYVPISSVLRVRVDPTSVGTFGVALKSHCESSVELHCEPLDGTDVYKHVPPGHYTIVVMGTVGEEFRLSHNFENLICNEGDSTCVDPDRAEVCIEGGSALDSVNCIHGCDPMTQNCLSRAGQSCENPIVTTSYSVVDDYWFDVVNDIDPGPMGCVPNTNASDGPDLVFEVDIPPGEILIARSDVDFTDTSLYLLTDCNDTTTCVAAANDSAFAAETLVFENDTLAPMTRYLVVDSTGGPSPRASIDFSVQPRVCTLSQCNGDQLLSCEEFGTLERDLVCSNGCNAGACNAVTNDTCLNALDISNSSFTGRIEEFTDEHLPQYCATGAIPGRGADASFSVTSGATDQIVSVEVTADFLVSLFSKSTCGFADCEIADHAWTRNHAALQFVLPANTTSFLVVDSEDSVTDGEFEITATLSDVPTCIFSDVSCSDASTLEYCGPFGLPLQHPCDSGCSMGQCGSPDGLICENRIKITPGTHSFDTAAFSRFTLEEGRTDQCYLANGATQGHERFYEIDLLQGEVMTVTLPSGYTGFLRKTCDRSECVAVSDAANVLKYRAEQDESVVLVVDGRSVSHFVQTRTFTVDVQMQSCVPGTPPFCGTPDSTTFCNPYGEEVILPCSTTCSNGACDIPEGRHCVDAILVFDGMTVPGDVLPTTAFFDAPLDSGSCHITEAAGEDRVYAIDLAAGDLLWVESDDLFNAYVLEDCYDLNSCGASSRAEETRLKYFADAARRVFVVVEHSRSDLHFTVIPGAICQPGESTCANATQAEVCSESGERVETTFTCANGCTNGKCLSPPQPELGCAGSPVIEPMITDLHKSDFTFSFSNRYHYRIDAQAGEVLRVRTTSHTGQDVIATISSFCASPTAVNPYHEQIFVVPTTGQYYIVIDPADHFTFQFDRLSPSCTPATPQCAGGGLEHCMPNNFVRHFPCKHGLCANGACVVPSGRSCADPVSIHDGLRHYADMTQDSTFPENNQCFLSQHQTYGNDAIYQVSMSTGERLVANYVSAYSVTAYVSTDCDDTTTCQATTPTNSSGSLEYTALADGDYFFTLDQPSRSFINNASVDFEIQAPCAFSGVSCVDPQTLEYCHDGFTRKIHCGGSCVNDACSIPTGDHCYDAIPAPNTTGVPFSITLNSTRKLQPPVSAACPAQTAGVDTVFKVDLIAGETLDVATTSGATVIYILDACDENACVAGSNGFPRTAVYTAPVDGTYFVVVDRSDGDLNYGLTTNVSIDVQ